MDNIADDIRSTDVDLTSILNILKDNTSLNDAKFVNKVLQDAYDSWRVGFVSEGGLTILINGIAYLNGTPNKTNDQYRTQYELLQALRSALSIGFEHVLSHPELLCLIALNIDNEDVAICTEVNL